MVLELQVIDVFKFEEEKRDLFDLVGKIWTGSESLANVEHSIERWGQSKSESGDYFYVVQDGKKVGLTGYFIPDIKNGTFGLRHHGTTIKGTGKQALELLISYLKNKYNGTFKCLVELIPGGKEDLIPKFQEWGFELSKDPMPSWEPKKDYYKYVMTKRA